MVSHDSRFSFSRSIQELWRERCNVRQNTLISGICTVPPDSGIWKLEGILDKTASHPSYDDSAYCWHGDGGYRDCNKVWPKTPFFLLVFCGNCNFFLKKDLPCRHINDPHRGRYCSLSLLPTNSLISISDPWTWTLWSWHSILQGRSTSAPTLLPELVERHKDSV